VFVCVETLYYLQLRWYLSLQHKGTTLLARRRPDEDDGVMLGTVRTCRTLFSSLKQYFILIIKILSCIPISPTLIILYTNYHIFYSTIFNYYFFIFFFSFLSYFPGSFSLPFVCSLSSSARNKLREQSSTRRLITPTSDHQNQITVVHS
jgi:hypothetical protein